MRSLYIFGAESWIRRSLFKVIKNPYFDYFMIAVVLVSCVTLAIDGPLVDPNSDLANNIFWVDFVTTMVFIGESLVKIIVYGFLFNGMWSYLR